MTSWEAVTEFYYDLLENKSDPRVKHWPTMSGPFFTTFVCMFYAYFVKVIGPKLMENRKPFGLRRVMIFYNLFQVILSCWLFYGILKNGWWSDYSFRCQPVDYSDNPKAIGMLHVFWWYYLSKYLEFFDTILFVLRKKYNNITVLHVYHHGIMPLLMWSGMKFVPGGHSTFFSLLNTFVHVIMYGYYFLAALGPKMHPYLWWKKYLTTLQLVQFALILLHGLQLFIFDCDYPTAFAWLHLTQPSIFLILFGNFYRKSYLDKDKRKAGLSASLKKR